MQTLDPGSVKEFALRVWQYKQGEVVSLMVYLGDRLGLYEGMAGGAPVTPAELASRAGLAERWVKEWLEGQAAAALVDRTDEGLFSLSAEGEEVLIREESLAFASGAFIGGYHPDRIEDIVAAFRTGIGITYHQLGPAVARQMDRMNKPWVDGFLLDQVLPSVPGLMDRLESGGKVCEVGSGGGITLRALAERFPDSLIEGYEPSGHAHTRALRRIQHLPNAVVHQAGGEDVPADNNYDLVLALDSMHDVPYPDRVAAAVRRSIRSDGVWMIKDIRCSERFEDNLANPMLALQYGYSVSACLLSAASSEDAAGLGTLGFHPAAARQITADAGFSHFREFRFEDDPVHNYYEVRP